MKEQQSALEFNFDGLVGPTHNYAGLSYGNIASRANMGSVSSPRQAARQGLSKMRMLMELGIPQAVLPPHQRPNFDLLRSLGFSGSAEKILQAANKYSPQLLAASYSAASMWTANMATVSASCNTLDGKLHITPANLSYNLHRAQEADFNYKLLKHIFDNPEYFKVHGPLPAYRDLSDEGAANHTSLCKDYGVPGLDIFVYGRLGLDDSSLSGNKFPGRQTKLASSANMRNHSLNPEKCFLLQQNPTVIDAGVFHNDVICVANKNVIFYHNEAFLNWQTTQQSIKNYFDGDCSFIEVSSADISTATAVETYLFNSQLISMPNNDMALILPIECKTSKQVEDLLNNIVAADNPIKMLKYVDCRQSMLNGGGPACLRLRVVMTEEQRKACHQQIILDQNLCDRLELWINTHYRDSLELADLLDPQLTEEVYRALDELTQLLALGSIYSFQQ